MESISPPQDLSELEKLPLDILKEIGLKLDYHIIRDYCNLSKNFRRICRDDFWKRKMYKDFSEEDIEPIVYDNNYINYLNTRQRWILNSDKYWGNEYDENSIILAKYLKEKHPNKFKLIFVDKVRGLPSDNTPSDNRLKEMLIDFNPREFDLFIFRYRTQRPYAVAFMPTDNIDELSIKYQTNSYLKDNNLLSMPVGLNYLLNYYGMSLDSINLLYLEGTNLKFVSEMPL